MDSTVITTRIVVDRVLNSFVFRSRVSTEFWFSLLFLFALIYGIWTIALSVYTTRSSNNSSASSPHKNAQNHHLATSSALSNKTRLDSRNAAYCTLRGKLRLRSNSLLAGHTAPNDNGDPVQTTTILKDGRQRRNTGEIIVNNNKGNRRKVSFDLMPSMLSIDTQSPPILERRSILPRIGSSDAFSVANSHNSTDVLAQLRRIGFDVEEHFSKESASQENIDLCVLLALILYRRAVFLAHGIDLYKKYYFASEDVVDDALTARACSFDERGTPRILKEIALEHRLKEESTTNIRDNLPCCLDDFLKKGVPDSAFVKMALEYELVLHDEDMRNNDRSEKTISSKLLSLLENNRMRDQLRVLHASGVFDS